MENAFLSSRFLANNWFLLEILVQLLRFYSFTCSMLAFKMIGNWQFPSLSTGIAFLMRMWHWEIGYILNGLFLQVKLSEYIGKKYVILFFYPLDFTFVCPTGKSDTKHIGSSCVCFVSIVAHKYKLGACVSRLNRLKILISVLCLLLLQRSLHSVTVMKNLRSWTLKFWEFQLTAW